MIPIRAIVVSVNYDDLLAITLPRNMRHLVECLVVTTKNDHRTHKVVTDIPGSRCFITDAFYRNGAKFNKGLAIEEALTVLGRSGWILLWDADILFPPVFSLPSTLDRDTLYGSSRKIIPDSKEWTPDLDWKTIPTEKDLTIPGYFQLFNAEAKCLIKRPWYGLDFIHAGGGDAQFMMKFSHNQRKKLPFDVLHLGQTNRDWFGRVNPRLDNEPIPEPLIQERSNAMKQLERSRVVGRFPWEKDKRFPV